MTETAESQSTEWTRNQETVQAHYSSIMLHRKCPQAWYFRYGLNLKRPVSGPAPYLHYGSWFGAMRTAEALVRGRKIGSLIEKPRTFSPVDDGPTFDMKTLTPKDVLEAAAAWWKVQAQDEEVVAEWQKALGQDLPNRLKGGFLRWRDEWGDEVKKERPLALEMFWKRSLPRPALDADWDANIGELPDLRLIGFIDELYEDIERGMIVVRDNKTTSRMPTQSSLDDMLDSQLQLYPWGVTPKLHRLGLNPPRAISYDRAYSVKPTSPKLNLNGSISAATKLYDVRTYKEWANTDTRPSTFEELQELATTNAKKSWDDFTEDQVEAMTNLPAGRLFGKIGTFTVSGAPKFGIYHEDPEMVQKLSAPDWRAQYHQRTLTPVNRQVQNAHLRAAVDTVTDIWRTQARAEVTFEAARNLSKEGCKWCNFLPLCRAQMFGGPDGQYDLREYGLRHKDGEILEHGSVTKAEALATQFEDDPESEL